MRLSEAIRRGAMLKPQLTNGVTRSADGTCALGAALEAIGSDRTSYAAAVDYFPIVLEDAVHPVSQAPAYLVLSIVRELNDTHHWTREAIADWVAGLEAAQAHDQPPSTNAVDPVAQLPGTLSPRV